MLKCDSIRVYQKGKAMVSLLLAIIYLAFISLGLPDSLLGSGWPVMYKELNTSISYAGIISMIISGGTILSSLMSDRVIRKLGTGLVTAISVFLTASALFGFSISNSFLMLCVFAVPYGLGAGAIDAALNNYVALNYSSKHMSWLHCFWGVGASISPYIMSFALGAKLGWRNGYRIVSIIQIVLTIIMFVALPLWKKSQSEEEKVDKKEAPLTIGQKLKIKGVVHIMIAFCAYSAFESTCCLWISTYLAEHRGMESQSAAAFASLFYLGITFGRFIVGFFADKIGDRDMIRLGISVILVGMIFIILPVSSHVLTLAGFAVIGLGAAPVYPAFIHSTPTNFGRKNSQAIIGMQMTSAYIGSTFMPPVFGFIAEHTSVAIFPFYLLFFVVVALVLSERLNRIVGKEKNT